MGGGAGGAGALRRADAAEPRGGAEPVQGAGATRAAPRWKQRSVAAPCVPHQPALPAHGKASPVTVQARQRKVKPTPTINVSTPTAAAVAAAAARTTRWAPVAAAAGLMTSPPAAKAVAMTGQQVRLSVLGARARAPPPAPPPPPRPPPPPPLTPPHHTPSPHRDTHTYGGRFRLECWALSEEASTRRWGGGGGLAWSALRTTPRVDKQR